MAAQRRRPALQVLRCGRDCGKGGMRRAHAAPVLEAEGNVCRGGHPCGTLQQRLPPGKHDKVDDRRHGGAEEAQERAHRRHPARAEEPSRQTCG